MICGRDLGFEGKPKRALSMPEDGDGGTEVDGTAVYCSDDITASNLGDKERVKIGSGTG